MLTAVKLMSHACERKCERGKRIGGRMKKREREGEKYK